MSAARRSSCSSSSRRYSHSSTRDRHSHSRCCSTAEGHGIEVIYLLGTKLLKIGQLEKSKIYRPAKGWIKREGAASRWSALPLTLFRKSRFAFTALRYFVLEHALAPEGQPHAGVRVRDRPGVTHTSTRDRHPHTRSRPTAEGHGFALLNTNVRRHSSDCTCLCQWYSEMLSCRSSGHA